MRIKVKYRGHWYEAKDVSIDNEGELSFEYLHGLEGCVDSEHVEEYFIITDEVAIH